MRSGTCPKCGSGKIAGPHGTLTGEGRLKLDLPGVYTTTLVALTCINCGYTEFYADEKGLQNLRRDGRMYSTDTRGTPDMCARCGTRLSPGSDICSECGNVID
ncbi:MAG: hypothetical protein BAJATHORv1_30505 [Candidatus Thorarchaeota archaeon]|nr:MAG: hypothetical protein BAJATHORv1_30505 [Candidatus Thorarchaeota archaeon]